MTNNYMHIRQSAPRPEFEDALSEVIESDKSEEQKDYKYRVPIGEEQIRDAIQTLKEYKRGKANLEQRVISNDQWYRLHNWDQIKATPDQIDAKSAYLFNCIMNKHADSMDNYPEANVLPREEGDKGEAEMLSSIIPVIQDRVGFESTYDAVTLDKLCHGTGIYGIYWDSSACNGMGDIAIRQIDILNIFWEPGITDIQESRNLFTTELIDNESLEELYPQLSGRLGSSSIDIARYQFDDTIDNSKKSVVVDWYYKKMINGRKVLHYCKFVNDIVLFSTENEAEFADRGWYDHGKYPFEFDTLFRIKGSPAGFGYIDVGKSTQEYIDLGNRAVLENMLVNSKPRYFVRSDGSINEAEFSDMRNDIVHVNGTLSSDSVMPINGSTLPKVYLNVLQGKIEELKETTGNRDVSNGGTTSGVTAASAIAAMQEAGSKLSRDSNKSSYRCYQRVVLQMIELVRQFYDIPRTFRILGERGMIRYVQYSNQNIIPRQQEDEFGVNVGYYTPLFDVNVTAQKQSPYSKMSQNELALSLYSAGVFNPQMAVPALALLDMMDFDRKETVMQKVAENFSMMIGMNQSFEQNKTKSVSDDNSKLEAEEEPSHMKKARQKSAEGATPR